MSKGSKRRREDRAAVEANWPFPDRRRVIPRYPSPEEFTPDEVRASYIPAGCVDRPDGTRVFCNGAVGRYVDRDWVVISSSGEQLRGKHQPTPSPVLNSQVEEVAQGSVGQGAAVSDVCAVGQDHSRDGR